MTKKEYLDTHTELKFVEKDIQDIRYEHNEKRRQEKIKKIKELRQEIISENNKSKQSQNKHKTETTVIKREREKLEMMERQQIGEIKNMIDFEVKQEEQRIKNQKKMEQHILEQEIKVQQGLVVGLLLVLL